MANGVLILNVSIPRLLDSQDAESEKDNVSKPQQHELISEEQYVMINSILALFTVLVSISGICTNAINITIFIKMGLNDGMNMIFLALALSDFTFCLVTIVSKTAVLCESIEFEFDFWFGLDPFAVFVFSNMVGIIIYIMVTLTTTFLAVARCMCVAKPFTFKNMFTRERTLFVLIAFAASSITLIAPILANQGIQYKFYPVRNASRLAIWLSPNREKIKDIVLLISHLGLSSFSEVINIVCVIIMISKLKESVRFRNNQDDTLQVTDKESTKLTGKERDVVLQVVLISFIFIICNLFKVCHSLVMLLDPRYDIGKPLESLYLIVSSSRGLFESINSSVNFLIYYNFNSRFRSLLVKKEGSRFVS